MTQIKPVHEYLSKTPVDQVKSDKNKPGSETATNEAAKPAENGESASKLYEALTTGPRAMATQKDLVELHKRVVAMFATLNEGLSQQQASKAKEDRFALERKMAAMSRTLDDMEGAIRIDLAPQVKEMVEETLSRRLPVQKRRGSPLLVMAAFAVGIGLGVYYSQEIAVLAAEAASWSMNILNY